MAARPRARGSLAKDDDAHEERNMWNQIVCDMKKLKALQAKAAEVSRMIVDTEEKMSVDSGEDFAFSSASNFLPRSGPFSYLFLS